MADSGQRDSGHSTSTSGVSRVPATPLPWEIDGDILMGDRTHIATFCGSLMNESLALDANYALHSANEYPRLVAALKDALSIFVSHSMSAKLPIERILRELGEI